MFGAVLMPPSGEARWRCGMREGRARQRKGQQSLKMDPMTDMALQTVRKRWRCGAHGLATLGWIRPMGQAREGFSYFFFFLIQIIYMYSKKYKRSKIIINKLKCLFSNFNN
jgi:hypothetical protein